MLKIKSKHVRYLYSFFFRKFFLFCFFLEFVVRHGDDGQNQIHEIKGPQEYDNYKKQHMPRASGAQNLGNITFVKIIYC